MRAGGTGKIQSNMACMVRENTDRLTYPNCEGKKILTRQSGTNSTHAVVALRSCDWGQGKSVDGRGDDARLQLLMIVVVLVRGGKKGGLSYGPAGCEGAEATDPAGIRSATLGGVGE